jgi:hypothetical protein
MSHRIVIIVSEKYTTLAQLARVALPYAENTW